MFKAQAIKPIKRQVQEGLSIFVPSLGASAYDKGLEPFINQTRHYLYMRLI